MAITPINIDRINEIWMDPRGQRAYVQKDAGSNGQSRVTFGADADGNITVSELKLVTP